MQNAHHNFPELSNQYSQTQRFFIYCCKLQKKKKILTFKMLEPANVWHFLLKKLPFYSWSVI